MTHNAEQKSYDPDAYMVREHVSPNVAGTEQNVRTRGELPWNGYPENPEVDGFHWLKQNGCGRLIPFEWDSCDEYWLFDDNSDGIPDEVAKLFKYHGPCLPPEARGAAEQRRKDAEGQEPVIYEYQDSAGQWVRSESQEHAENWAEILGTNYQALYTRPANVAALGEETERLFQHVKRGTEYRLIGRGKIQQNGPSDMAEVVIYQDVNDGSFWVRSPSEFYDGRFKEIFDVRAALTREGGVS